MIATCPHCGRAVYLSKIGPDRGGAWSQMRPLELSMPRPWATTSDDIEGPARPGVGVNFTPSEVGEYIRTEPVRAASWEADVLVCLGQSLGSGAFIALFAGGLAVWREWPWYVPAICAGFTSAAAWFVTVADGRSMLRRVERVIGKDIDGDGHTGQPEPILHEYAFRETRPDGSESWAIVLGLPDIGPEKLATFARAILGGASTGTSAWVGTGGIFSRAQYDMLRDTLVSKGLARWVSTRSKAAGWSLTRKGAELFAKLADGETT